MKHALTEIDAYRTNKRVTHIENAMDLWYTFVVNIWSNMFDRGHAEAWLRFYSDPRKVTHEQKVSELCDLARKSRSFYFEVNYLRSTTTWFKVDPSTEAILTAFDDLVPKVTFRMIDRTDLGQISDCLKSLAGYLYTRISELSDTEVTRKEFEVQSNEWVQSFAKLMNQMPRYQSEKAIEQPRTVPTDLKRRIADEVSHLFCSPLPYVRFFTWWILVQISMGVLIIFFLETVKSLHLDSTLIALALGSPLAVAAALTAIPVYSKPDQ